MAVKSIFQNEEMQLAALSRLKKLNNQPEKWLDQITTIVAWFFNAPISIIGLLLKDEIIAISLHGIDRKLADHRPEWCKAAFAADDVYCISNALDDPRVKGDPLVIGDFGLRFFASALMRTQDGRRIGALTVIDRKPREISAREKEFLKLTALLAVDLIESHLNAENPQSPAPLDRFRIDFNHSILRKPKTQQLDWLAKYIIGKSSIIEDVRERLRLAIVKQVDTVLLVGGTGAGKGVCALAIHEGSGARGRFIEVNCAALPHDLIESELFGHEKGSFTGATNRKIGLFEQANGGTIFLDEIAELPPDLQVKLLTVLQGRELRRVGGEQAILIDVRVIAATNRRLEIALNDGSFRRDLFFRIGSWRIEIPPLRDRGRDVIELARYFVAQLATNKGYNIEGISPGAEILLEQYDWPGNVRQLLNIIEHATILESGFIISQESIRRALEEEKKLFPGDEFSLDYVAQPHTIPKFKRTLISESDAQMIIETLARNRNNKSKAAKELGITRGQLNYRLKLIQQTEK
jgi:transcriptional regulator with GAF, ATPase, and Fis domain